MRKVHWKKLLLSFVAVFTAVVLLACGNTASDEGTSEEGSATDGEVAQIEFWSFWGSGPRRETIEAIIEDFNASQDEIEVTHVYQPWGDIWTKSLAAVTAGNPPNIVVQDINTVRQRADANQATNIQEYLDAEDENLSERFYPQLWDTVIHEEEAYGLPFNTDTQVLFYNKDIFEEAGLDPEQPPTTWAEIEEYGRELDVQDGDNWERFGFKL